MSDFLDELKVRIVDAQKRLQIVQQELQTIQNKYQAVAQEFNSLQVLLNAENAKLQQNDPNTASAVPVQATASVPQTADLNQTDMIRALIRQHPAGMSPAEIWKQVKGQMTHRAYLYSILKRLREKDEVFVRRKKYIAKTAPRVNDGDGQVFVQ